MSNEKDEKGMVLPIRPPAERSNKESPDTSNLLDYTPVQLRQTILDLQRQMGQLAVRIQEEQGVKNRVIRELKDENDESAKRILELRQLRAELLHLETEMLRERSSANTFSVENVRLRAEIERYKQGPKKSLLERVFRLFHG